MHSDQNRAVYDALRATMSPAQFQALQNSPEAMVTIQMMVTTFVAQVQAVLILSDTITAQRNKLQEYAQRVSLPMEIRP